MQKLSKQQLRVKETRARLLDAAERVIVQKGYERAQLDEIATLAGRSKGSIYAHFKSKEDLFLALLENRTRTYYQLFSEKFRQSSSRKESLRICRKAYLDLAYDRSWHLMTLEFKMFALRHPKVAAKLARVSDIRTYESGNTPLSKLLLSSSRAQSAEDRLSVVILSPFICGMILESNINQKVLPAEVLRRFIGTIFDALFPEGK